MTVAFMTEIMRCVPGLNDDLIREHIARHDKLLDLLDRKKELLSQYKEVKQHHKQLNADLVFEMQQPKENKNSSNLLSTEDQVKRKQDLEKWKFQKEQARKQEIEEKKRKEEEQQYKQRSKLEEERRMKKE